MSSDTRLGAVRGFREMISHARQERAVVAVSPNERARMMRGQEVKGRHRTLLALSAALRGGEAFEGIDLNYAGNLIGSKDKTAKKEAKAAGGAMTELRPTPRLAPRVAVALLEKIPVVGNAVSAAQTLVDVIRLRKALQAFGHRDPRTYAAATELVVHARGILQHKLARDYDSAYVHGRVLGKVTLADNYLKAGSGVIRRILRFFFRSGQPQRS